MNKDEFLSLHINEQVKYLNSRLSNGETVIRIREDLKLGEKALQRLIKEGGYKYLQKERLYAKSQTSYADYSENNRQTSINTMVENKSQPLDIPNNFKDDLFEIITAKERIFNILDIVENKWQTLDVPIIEIIQDDGIKIDLPDTKEEKRVTIRLNKEVSGAWDEFCKSHNEFGKQDLHAMALLEYITKYKK